MMSRRARGILMIVLTCLNVAVTGRFVSTFFIDVPPYTLDWSPAVYWLVGIIVSAISLQTCWHIEHGLHNSHGSALLIVNGLCFTTYVALALTLFWSNFSQLA